MHFLFHTGRRRLDRIYTRGSLESELAYIYIFCRCLVSGAGKLASLLHVIVAIHRRQPVCMHMIMILIHDHIHPIWLTALILMCCPAQCFTY